MDIQAKVLYFFPFWGLYKQVRKRLQGKVGLCTTIFAFAYSVYVWICSVMFASCIWGPYLSTLKNSLHNPDSMPEVFGSGWHSCRSTVLNIVLLCFILSRTICPPWGGEWHIGRTLRHSVVRTNFSIDHPSFNFLPFILVKISTAAGIAK